METNENTTGRIAASYVSHFLFPCHRGVINNGDNLIIFGNDGWPSGRVRKEVEYVRARLPQLGLEEESFGEDGYSWAIVCRNYKRLDVEMDLEEILNDGWRMAWEAREQPPTNKTAVIPQTTIDPMLNFGRGN